MGSGLVKLGLVVLLLWIRLISATPVGHSSSNGPLGASPGGPQGPIPIGAGDSSNGTTGPSISEGARGADTILAIFSALLMTVTYAVLIGPGTRLASTSKVPLGPISANIGNLLSRSWPDTSVSSLVGSVEKTMQDLDAIRLLYVGKMDEFDRRTARGLEQSKALPSKRIDSPPMWLTKGSSLTKSMAQLTVWEWVSMWMTLAMVFSTLLFNGFFTNKRNPDSYARLVVVLIYLVSFCVHAWYVWRVCRNFFTLLGAGATWSLLNKASFASVDLSQLNTGILGGPTPVFRQVGKPAASATFPAFNDCYLNDVDFPNRGQRDSNNDPVHSDEDIGAANTINDWQKREISTTVDAGKAALGQVVTNVMTIVGITITTGFAAWTSMASSADSTTQLGSLALLASLTLDTGAMFSSAIELSVMNTSFRSVLFLKEVMINGQAPAHVQKRARKKNIIGFTHNTVPIKAVRMMDFVKSTSLLGLLIFEPGYALLPSEEDHFRQSAGEFRVGVRGRDVVLTTETTNRHQKRRDGSSIEAINVCTILENPAGSGASTIGYQGATSITVNSK